MTPADPKDRPPESALAQPAVTEHGARVELRFSAAQSNATRCTYNARWFIGAEQVDGAVTIAAPAPGAKTSPSIELTAPELPPWLSTFTVQLLKVTCRSVLAEEPDFARALWPRRITRWRNSRITD